MDENRLEEIIAQAQRAIETAIRRVNDKHGSVSLHFERGIRELPDDGGGHVQYEHTDRWSITIDAPSPADDMDRLFPDLDDLER